MSPSNPKPIFNDLLFHVSEATFGELAFMLVMPEDMPDGEPVATDWGYAGEVDFQGPFTGRLYVAITEDMLVPLAANMLGMEPGEEPPEGVKQEDALKELINVVCGNLLPAIAGDEVVFTIGGPAIMDKTDLPVEVEGMDFWGETEMTLDSGRAQLKLFIEQGADVPVPARRN